MSSKCPEASRRQFGEFQAALLSSRSLLMVGRTAHGFRVFQRKEAELIVATVHVDINVQDAMFPLLSEDHVTCVEGRFKVQSCANKVQTCFLQLPSPVALRLRINVNLPVTTDSQSSYTMSAAKKSVAPRKKVAASSHPPFADMIKVMLTLKFNCRPRVTLRSIFHSHCISSVLLRCLVTITSLSSSPLSSV